MFLTVYFVGFASVDVDLLVSAISWKSAGTANLLLPLVMIAQIVFSVAVARDVASYQKVIRKYVNRRELKER